MKHPVRDLPLAPPTGMADILPPDAAARQHFAGRLTDVFASFGYELVTTPLFEHAAVIERGLDSGDRRALLRFVEPDSGELALLRPDITPQIARIIATRLAHRPAPWRIAYRGTVIRRPQGRARTRRQITQAGIELAGWSGVRADAEVIEVAAAACRASGLSDFQLELGHVKIAAAAMSMVPEPSRAAAAHALAAKDRTRLESILKAAGVPAKHRRDLLKLTALYGPVSILRRSRGLARRLGVENAIDSLEALVDELGTRGVGRELAVDLGELRGQAYYSGMNYQVLAAGPGERIGGGGRYDSLIGRFGSAQPATGFGLDLENLLEAAGAAAAKAPRPTRVALMAKSASHARTAIHALRDASIASAEIPTQSRSRALAFVEQWDYDALVVVSKSGYEIQSSCGAHRTRQPHRVSVVEAISSLLADRKEK